MMPLAGRRTRGLSIVELVVALAVLSFAAFGIYDSILGAARSGRLWEEQIERDLIAQQELAHLLAAPYHALAAYDPLSAPATIQEHPRFLRQVQVEKAADGLLTIRVQVGVADLQNEREFASGHTVFVAGVKAP